MVAPVVTTAIGAGLIGVAANFKGIQGHRNNPMYQGEMESREGIGVKRSRWSPEATANRGRTKDVEGGVAYALITCRFEPDRIVDRRGEGILSTANRHYRRNHEDAIKDTADASNWRRPRSSDRPE